MPDDDRGLGQEFAALAKDRFIIGSPDEVAEQMLAIHRRLGVNHLVMSTEWAGMPESLALETIDMLAREVFPRVRQARDRNTKRRRKSHDIRSAADRR